MPALHRITALALLVAQLPACHGWRLESARPENVVLAQRPSQVRATLTRGERVVLHDPFLVPDSLPGRTRGDTIAVPLRNVVALETRHTKAAATGLAVLGGVLGAAVLVLVIGCAASDCSIN